MAYTEIDRSDLYFNTKLYTGTGSTQSISGVGFAPDWVWIKGRSGATDHGLYDAVRGVTEQLESNTTTAETTEATGLTAFGTDGFTVGALAQLNTSSATYASWNWKANGAGVSNTDGSITSTVSANTTSGFSVGKTTGTLSSGTITVGHGLGTSNIGMVLWKRTDGVSNWQVYHKSTGVNLTQLNTTGAVTSGTNHWGTPTSTTFTVENSLYGAGETYVYYCFAEKKGFSKFGSYTGNGSADGTFVYTGFKPAWVMIKTDLAGEEWGIWDSTRNTFNIMSNRLQANSSAAESTFNGLDFTSQGFKLRSSNSAVNYNATKHIYMAFASNPFVTSSGIPVTAR